MRPNSSILFLTLALMACSGPDRRIDSDDIDSDDTDVECVDSDNDGFTTCDGDCDDSQPAINPFATDLVGDGIDQNCDGVDGFDGDGDGYASVISGGEDCDDTDHFTFPGAIEIWYDGKAQGCQVGPNEPWDDGDQDGDGFAAASVGGKDCLDTNPNVNPSQGEINGNGLDDNCNGEIDNLHASYEWTPYSADTVFTFTMHDVTFPYQLLLYSMSDDYILLGSTGSVPLELQKWESNLYDEFTTMTYGLDAGSNRKFSVTGTQCVVWGPRATEVAALYLNTTCAESDPTTW